MPPVIIEGDTLGEKHRLFNKLVADAIADKHYELCNIRADDSDVDNLLKIHIACKTRNVDYIMEVMKSTDMLYAATAIKKSTWLIIEQQYAHIINPEYLHTQLLPSMNPKSFNKLMLHIRLNLKDETRVETFYEYLKDIGSPYKWLQNCSIPFIENVLKNERFIPVSLFKRLCRRSAHLIAYYRYIRTPYGYDTCRVFKASLFLLKSHSAELLKVLEQDNNFFFPRLGKKKTNILMKICAQKVFDNFENYLYSLDLSVVAKHLKKTKIRAFLYEQVEKIPSRYYLCIHENLRPFLANMPEEERFEFVKKTFIDKTELVAFYPGYQVEKINQSMRTYQWYEFTPFNVAMPELKKLLRTENSFRERSCMLSILITCARRNLQHVKTLLNFVKDNHINEPFKFKIQFVNNLLSQIPTHEFDVETWNVLDQLFHSMDVYTESDNNVQLCLQSIVLYKVLHDEPVLEIVEQKIIFDTFKEIQRKLDKKQNDKIFTYLLNSVLMKVQQNFADESNFNETIVNLKNALSLLRDWNKDIRKYPSILGKIRELIKIKQDNFWKADLSCLYNMKKSWRKHMFEESLSLSLCEETCLNALKHKPQLLARHDKEIDALRADDAVSLRRLLARLRVYWPHSLAQQWTHTYLRNLNKPTGQKAVIRGLFTLLPQNQVNDMAIKYAPDDFKINWNKTDQVYLSIQKNIAQYLHLARPLVSLDTVLLYAKGDYLQYAVPSLNALMLNLNEADSRKCLFKLLDAPVSLQKFGIHLAISKLKPNDLKAIFPIIWNHSFNLTIRSALFKHIYAQICKTKDLTVGRELWNILNIFMDNLTAHECSDIYKNIGNVQNVPFNIRAEFYMKSYEFLTSLPASANCDGYVKDLIEYATKIMPYLDEDFVINKILAPAKTKFCSFGSEVLEIFACFVLCGKSEEEQVHRFRRVVEPAIDEAFQLWSRRRFGNYYVRDNLKKFLSALVWYFRVYFVTLNETTLPVKLYKEIKIKLEQGLPFIKNYVLHTSWKLVTEYIQVMDELRSTFSEFEPSSSLESDFRERWMSNEINLIWIDIHSKVSPTLGPIIVKHLKEDCEQCNFITMYSLFTEALEKMLNGLFIFEDVQYSLETLKHMLNDSDFIQSYFVVSKLTPKCDMLKSNCKIRSKLRKKLASHPSKSVRTHYYNDFKDTPEDYDE